jgi:hypothetical protein
VKTHRIHKKFFVQGIASCLAGFLLMSCGNLNPHNVDVELPASTPQEKITSYTQMLSQLGLMTRIYDPGELKIQSQDIADNTGAAVTTGAEIQRNITEIMKSTLNSIGGEVTFIEYDPSFIQNQMVTGYGNFEYKSVPDVVVTGGITEFDRGLVTHGEGTDLDAEVQATGLPSWVPGDTAGFGFSDTNKAGMARITLDFNLKNFQTLAGIPKMTTTNSMEVHKALHEKELGITLFGPTFGLKGTTKKVQGRHEAVRLLVQVSMIQMVGKYLALPYWKLLGDDARPDPVVLDAISSTYYNMEPVQQVLAVQQWLVLHGYQLELTGELDTKTTTALHTYDPSFLQTGRSISQKLFSDIYLNIPVERATLARRKHLDNLLVALDNEPEPQPAVAAPQPQPGLQQVAEVQQPALVQTDRVATAVARESAGYEKRQQKEPLPAKRISLGRKLSDDEW